MTTDLIHRLQSLRVVLGIDSPEVRGWAPVVQQEARRTLDAAISALAVPSSPCAPAEPAAQGGEPKIPAGWVPLRVEWEPGYPEDVAFGPQRMMDRLKKWLDCYFAMRLSESATPAPASPSASTAAAAVAGEPVAFVHWPLSGPPRLVWYSNKAMNAAILKEGHQPDLLLYAAPQPSPGAQAPAPACGLSEEQEREAFEAVMRRDTFDALELVSDGTYRSYEARVGWICWLARARLTHPDATKETP